MSGHTPGPWRVVSDPPDHEGFVQHRIRATAGPVAEVFYVTKEGAADARLIAAAPDLLAACEAASVLMDAFHGSLTGQVSDAELASLHNATAEMLSAAIAKATGETP